MPQSSARRTALVALQLWHKERRRADAIISHMLDQGAMASAERGFALELFYGVLRNLTLLDFWIHCLRPSRLEAEVQDILRLGLYQLFLIQTPEHAAVNESVELTRGRRRGLINGILRTAIRQREELQNRLRGQPLSVRKSHPDFILARWQKNLGLEAAAKLCDWNNEPPPIYGRVNQLKIDLEQFAHRYPEADRLPHHSDFLRFPALPTEALERGHCYIQDPSTALVCKLLDPQPGETILDACAAPGGKTAYLAQSMKNRGLIAACDRDPRRLAVLKTNIARLDAKIVQPVELDWEKANAAKKIKSIAPFDRILIDAPCTNTGVMRRRVDLRWRLQPKDFERMPLQQLRILEAAARCLKPGGVLVYGTCSLEPEENEHLIERWLADNPEMRLLEQQTSLPFRDKYDGAFAAKLVRTAAA